MKTVLVVKDAHTDRCLIAVLPKMRQEGTRLPSITLAVNCRQYLALRSDTS